MIFDVIKTGSKGNCTILNNNIAVDMGVSYKLLGDYTKKIKLVLLTHIHSDHFNVKTISTLTRNHPTIKFACCEHLVNELANIVDKKNIFVLESNKTYDLGICMLSPFMLNHDVTNNGWRIIINNEKCIYATDTTTLNVIAKNYDLYLVEANYDMNEIIERIREKKANGEFIYEYRALNNHLSKQQCDEWLELNKGANSQVVYMHQHVDGKAKDEELNS